MWVSTRSTFGESDPGWADYKAFIGLPSLNAIRTMDSALNEYVDGRGSYRATSLEEAWDVLTMLPEPVDARQYYLLIVDAQNEPLPQEGRGCKLLGYDLSDETHTSTLLNCGRWDGELSIFTQRLNACGLLARADAFEAQAILPRAWPNDPHAHVTVWALYELTPRKPA